MILQNAYYNRNTLISIWTFGLWTAWEDFLLELKKILLRKLNDNSNAPSVDKIVHLPYHINLTIQKVTEALHLIDFVHSWKNNPLKDNSTLLIIETSNSSY